MILILSKENFEASTEQVSEWLSFFGAKYHRINGDTCLLNSKFIYKIDNSFEEENSMAEIIPNGVTFVWYRRYFDNNYFDEIINSVKKLIPNSQLSILHEYLKLEKSSLDRLILNKIKNIPSLSSHGTSFINKIECLEFAKSLEINIPATLISNSKIEINNFAKKQNVIVKNIKDVFAVNTKFVRFSSKTVVPSRKQLNKIDDKIFPSLLQEKIEKLFEIRAFYLDNKFYSMAIFSQANEKTEIDFRNYDMNYPNRTVPYKLPKGLEVKLKLLLKKFKLKTASIDLIMAKNGIIYFLEINPVGQFGMVSHPCNYNLERKIAKYLIKKSKLYEKSI